MDQQQLRSRLQGCYVTIPTLFDDDSLEVNFEGISQHVEFLIAGGLQEGTGLILSGGGAGDFFCLLFRLLLRNNFSGS